MFFKYIKIFKCKYSVKCQELLHSGWRCERCIEWGPAPPDYVCVTECRGLFPASTQTSLRLGRPQVRHTGHRHPQTHRQGRALHPACPQLGQQIVVWIDYTYLYQFRDIQYFSKVRRNIDPNKLIIANHEKLKVEIIDTSLEIPKSK